MINKSKLQSIISKYYLNGLVQSVRWVTKNNKLSIRGCGRATARVHSAERAERGEPGFLKGCRIACNRARSP